MLQLGLLFIAADCCFRFLATIRSTVDACDITDQDIGRIAASLLEVSVVSQLRVPSVKEPSIMGLKVFIIFNYTKKTLNLSHEAKFKRGT